MSRKKWEKLEQEYAEAILFQDVLKKLQFESVGEFVELVGGVMGMINVNDIDNAKKISEAFALRIGYILDKIGYVDKLIDNNKSMRQFYEEHQKKLSEQEEAKKKVDSGSVIIEELVEMEGCVKTETELEQKVTEMMGSNPWDWVSEEDRKKIIEQKGNVIEPVMQLQLDPEIFKITAKHIGSGWYELSTGKRVRGKNNLPENVMVEE